MIVRADKSRLYEDVNFLSNIFPFRNYKNLDSLEKAARYIHSELFKTGLSVSSQHWQAGENTYENIIAAYNPQRRNLIIVGAHYDVYYDQPGADDNASGVAGVLELARLLAANIPGLNYGIDLVSYCLEEPPFFKKKEMGSYIHAKSVFEKNQDVMGMISLEMIGYYFGKMKPDFAAHETEENSGTDHRFIVLAGIKKFAAFNDKLAQLMTNTKKIGIRKKTFSDDNPNNGPSDHRNYWTFHYPGIMLIGGKENGNPNYHKITDTIETLDFDTMTTTVEVCYDAITKWF